MPKNRIIVVLGALVALLPALGFPRGWEAFFQILAGLSIVLFSVWSTIDKKLTLKAKARERMTRKVPTSDAESSTDTKLTEVKPGFTKRVTDFYPRTAPPGRRITDIKPNLNPSEEEF